jgi:hypothetical protein
MPDPRVRDDVVFGPRQRPPVVGTTRSAAALDRTRGLPHRQRECETQPMLRLDDEWVRDAWVAVDLDAERYLVTR